MTKLHTFVSAPYLLNAWMNFNEIGVRCSPYGDDVQNMHFNYVGSRSRSQFKVKWPSYTLSCLLHISWMPGWIFYKIGVRYSPHGDDVQNTHFNCVGSRSRSQFKVKWPSGGIHVDRHIFSSFLSALLTIVDFCKMKHCSFDLYGGFCIISQSDWNIAPKSKSC